jgi:cytoskeletal protein RodZ
MTGFTSKKLKNLESTGEKLQKHRAAKKYTIDKAARALSINARYLILLENDAYDKLPPDVYTLNILMNYAKLLDLNPHTVVDLYKKEKSVYEKVHLRKENTRFKWLFAAVNFFLNPRFFKYSAFVIIIALVFTYIGWSINRIIAPPMLEIESPAANMIISENVVDVKGKTEKEVNLTINGRPLLSDQSGSFFLRLDLQKGLNIIKIAAQKKHSKENVIYRKIIVLDDK